MCRLFRPNVGSFCKSPTVASIQETLLEVPSFSLEHILCILKYWPNGMASMVWVGCDDEACNKLLTGGGGPFFDTHPTAKNKHGPF